MAGEPCDVVEDETRDWPLALAGSVLLLPMPEGMGEAVINVTMTVQPRVQRLTHVSYGILSRLSACQVPMGCDASVAPTAAKEMEARDGIIGVDRQCG
jgi:hypothetical protein